MRDSIEEAIGWSLTPAEIRSVAEVTFRVARKDTHIGGTPIPAGTRVVCSLAGANRDPARWEDPHAFMLDRPKIKEHLGFGRGAHTCIGAALARAEVRVILERLLAQTSRIELAVSHHGTAGQRRLDYEAELHHPRAGIASCRTDREVST